MDLSNHRLILTRGYIALCVLLVLQLAACHAAANEAFSLPALGSGTRMVSPGITPAVATKEQPGTSTPPPTAIPTHLGKVAFLQEGDIWIQSIAEREARRVTTGGNYRTPQWSRSGEWLAFHEGEERAIRLAHIEEPQLLRLNGVGPFEWSPTEDRLAYFGDPTHLHLFDPKRRQSRTISLQPPGRPSGEATRFAWSPDGKWLAYEWWEWEENQVPSHNSLWKVPAAGGEVVKLYHGDLANEPGAILVGWSSEGKHLLFWEHLGSASRLADGTALQALSVESGRSHPMVIDHKLENSSEKAIVLFHDSFVTHAPPVGQGVERSAMVVGAYRATWENKRLGVANVDTGTVRLLTPDTVAATTPSWSPDGTQLVYVAMPPLEEFDSEQLRHSLMQRHLEIIDGENNVRLLTDARRYRDERPLWSADGSHILFVRMNAQNQVSLWLIPTTGGDPRRIVTEISPVPGWHGYYGHIEWEALFDWWRPSPNRTGFRK